MVIGVIMGFVFTLALEPEKIVLWGIAVIGLSIQAVNVAATLKVFRAVHHTPLAINVLYYANSKTEETTTAFYAQRAEEKERERVLANDFPLGLPPSGGGAKKDATVLVGLPVHTARTIALDSTSSDTDEDRQVQAHKSKATEETKHHKPRGKTTFTAA
ncbi:hypothetical protein MRX96_007807 [Rhipicephalus microplus]